jgi:hypothetical protein
MISRRWRHAPYPRFSTAYSTQYLAPTDNTRVNTGKPPQTEDFVNISTSKMWWHSNYCPSDKLIILYVLPLQRRRNDNTALRADWPYLSSEKFSATLQDTWKKRRFLWIQQTKSRTVHRWDIRYICNRPRPFSSKSFQVRHSQSIYLSTSVIHFRLTPYIRVIFEKLTSTLEIPRFLYNTKFHCRVHNIQTLVTILSQLNPVHLVSFYFFRLKFIVISHVMLWVLNGLFIPGFPTTALYTFPPPPYLSHAPSHPHMPYFLI